jgi:hypothetical protein
MRFYNKTFLTSNSDKIWILVASVLAMAVHAWANMYGLGFTRDSNKYLVAGQTLIEYGTFFDENAKKLLGLPPLFIVIVASMGEKARSGMIVMNSLLIGTSVFIMLQIAWNILQQRVVRIIYAVTLTFGVPLLLVHSFFWTEPFFIFLLVLHWYVLFLYSKNRNNKWLLLLAFTSVLFCLQRKAGMFFILANIIYLIIHSGNQISKKHIISFIAVSFLGLLAWQSQSLYTFNGRSILERPKLSGLIHNLDIYFDAFSAWLLPLPVPFIIRLAVLLCLFLMLGYGFYRCYNKIDLVKKQFIIALTLQFSTYFLCRLFWPREDFHEMDRYLSPIYPIVFLVIFAVLEEIAEAFNFKKTVIIISAIWLLYPVSRTLKNAHMWHTGRAKFAPQVFPHTPQAQ